MTAGEMSPPTLLLVVSAAPPARHIHELAALLLDDGWDTHAITTPVAADWIDVERLAATTRHPVHTQTRRPDQPRTLPAADALALVPATFNTINKWATGVNDTRALGALNEALGSGLPIVAAPYAKPALASHPAFARHLRFLREAGVTLTGADAIRPLRDGDAYRWATVVDLLRDTTRQARRSGCG